MAETGFDQQCVCADPLTSTGRSGLRIRTAKFPKSLYSSLVLAFRRLLKKDVLPPSSNSPAKNLWYRNGLDLAVLLAEFQRPFLKREYGGSNPPAPANQSGLCVWRGCQCESRAVWRIPALASSLWIPKSRDERRFLLKISGCFRRYSQIFGDVNQRLVRSSTAWSGWQSCRA